MVRAKVKTGHIFLVFAHCQCHLSKQLQFFETLSVYRYKSDTFTESDFTYLPGKITLQKFNKIHRNLQK
jgi:hypothetical protein